MVAPRINLLKNPRPVSLASWDQYGTLTFQTGAAANGLSGFLRTGIFAQSGAAEVGQRLPFATAQPPAPVPVSVWVRSSAALSGGRGVSVEMSFEGAGGTFLAAGNAFASVPRAVAANVWTRLDLSGTATTAYRGIYVKATARPGSGAPLPAGMTLDVCQFMLGDAGAYLDGDLPDVDGVSYWWNGPPYASSSTAARIVQATPDLDTASVLLEVNVDPSLSPTVIYERTALEIAQGYTPAQVNDYYNWTGWAGHELVGTSHMKFRTAAETGSVARPISNLIVGRQYRIRVAAARGATAIPFGASVGAMSTIPAGSGTWTHEHVFTATATTHSIVLGSVARYTAPVELVSLDLLPVGYVAGQFTLTRTDANGTRPVRLLGGQALTGGQLVVEDAEAAMTGPITYSLNYGAGASISTSTALEGSRGYRLAPAVFPQFAATVGIVTGYNGERPTSTIIHDVIGRTDPVARIGPFRTRRGTLTIWCDDYPGVSEAMSVYARGEVVQLRQPDYPGLDMYHVTTRATERPYDEEGRRWRVDVEYIEVGYPRGPLLGTAGWTWDDLVATFATWDDVLAYFATWNDVQIGPTT